MCVHWSRIRERAHFNRGFCTRSEYLQRRVLFRSSVLELKERQHTNYYIESQLRHHVSTYSIKQVKNWTEKGDMCEKTCPNLFIRTDPLLHIICSLHYISCVSEQVKGILTGGQENMYQIYFISTQKRAHAQPAEKKINISAQTNSWNTGREFDQL